MSQQVFFDPIPLHRLECFSKSDLIILFKGEQGIRKQLEKDNKRLRELNRECKQKRLGVDDDYIVLKNKFFGKSSEKQAKPEVPEKKRSSEKSGKKRVLLPSLRYPDTALIERDVELEKLPHCGCCGHEMRDTGLTENSEHLTVIPSQYMVIRQKRHKYSCGKCYGSMVTAPSPPKVKPGGGYSDEMMIDVSVSKYCDLIPIERYVRMASRLGISDIPPQSLIEQTHSLGKFIEPVYKRLKEGILSSKVLHADETTHRMLEGSKKSNWYLWGFSTPRDSYFDIRDSRSGSVASEFLLKSQCEYLVSDVFSGYAKAVREVNRDRVRQNTEKILNVYCNAHARRKFRESLSNYVEEAEFFIDFYKKIYRLNKISLARPPNRVLRVRRLMKPVFEKMKSVAMERMGCYSSRSSIGKAMSYFLRNYEELTLFVDNRELPVDNNSQERLLRSPVIGRKTWYGTHSVRGSRTAAILFSVMESCKLNGVNPREYLRHLVEDIHQGKDPYTPYEFKTSKEQ